MKKIICAYGMCLLLAVLGTSCGDSGQTSGQEILTPPKISLESEREVTVGDKGSRFSVAFSASANWSVSSSQSWCKPSVGSGGPGKITVPVDVDVNEQYESREAILTIASGTVKTTVNLLQAQKDAILVAKNKYEVTSEESVLEFELQANVELKVATDVEWIKQQTAMGRGLTKHQLVFRIEANPGGEPREGHIVISKGNLKQTITVLQKVCKVQQLIIIHQLDQFLVPSLEGKITDGTIQWGDNQEEVYQKGAQHRYESEGNYRVIIQTKGTERMSLKSVKGITEIDFSNFK